MLMRLPTLSGGRRDGGVPDLEPGSISVDFVPPVAGPLAAEVYGVDGSRVRTVLVERTFGAGMGLSSHGAS